MKHSRRLSKESIFLLGILIFFTACNKEPENDTPPPGHSEKQLRINFSNGSIKITDVDSAEVILTKPGLPSVTKKLEKATGYMFAAVTDIPDGNWKAEWLLYTKKPTAGYARQFSKNDVFVFPLAASRLEQAPAGDWTGGWNPRVLAHDESAKLTYIIAMDFADPFFAVINKSNKALRYVYIDRIARKLNNSQSQVIGSKEFEIFFGIPMAGIIDRLAFLPLTTEMQGKPWNEGEILVEVLDGQDLDRTFYFKYQR